MAYTKKIYYKAIKEYFSNNEIVIPKTAIQDEGELQDNITSESIVNFVTHEIELLSKKASKSGNNKLQQENRHIMDEILTALYDFAKPVTVTELMKVVNYSNQKLTALLTKLINEKKVVRIIDKKKSYFTFDPDYEN